MEAELSLQFMKKVLLIQIMSDVVRVVEFPGNCLLRRNFAVKIIEHSYMLTWRPFSLHCPSHHPCFFFFFKNWGGTSSSSDGIVPAPLLPIENIINHWLCNGSQNLAPIFKSLTEILGSLITSKVLFLVTLEDERLCCLVSIPPSQIWNVQLPVD